ncbi:PAS domain-containing protein [Ferrovibrio sp.]|uniref:PAS domain-containing protein n=1 Tax=Ferrovibrio sp. TaxID=1917215 RepID=UPI003D0B3BB2
MDDAFRTSIGHQGLHTLYDYWRELKAGRTAPPQRSSFDPLRFGPLLSSLIINEALHGQAADGGVRFRIRLEGDDIVRARGSSAKGRYLDEPGVLLLNPEATINEYRGIVASGQPSYSEGRFHYAQHRYGRMYRLALPFAGLEHPERVDFLFVDFRYEI